MTPILRAGLGLAEAFREVIPDVQVWHLGLRRDERTASIPVLALTAQAMHGDRERFLEAGFNGYVSKPVDVIALLRTIEEYCGDL